MPSLKIRRLTSTVALILTAGACGSEAVAPREPSKPVVKINAPKNGATIKGNVVDLSLSAAGIQIVRADGDRSGKSGHYHIFIDRDPVEIGRPIPRNDPQIIHSAGFRVPVEGLSVGRHRFAVVLANGAHERVGETQARIAVDVAGPSVRVTAPKTARVGTGIVLSVKIEGVNLVAANGDKSGTTGHLHVFIDRDPAVAGKPIPKEEGIIHTTSTEISLQLLPRGDHTVIVVLGDGNHVPFGPPVVDRVSFTIV